MTSLICVLFDTITLLDIGPRAAGTPAHGKWSGTLSTSYVPHASLLRGLGP
jgi:hypothetical protein